MKKPSKLFSVIMGIILLVILVATTIGIKYRQPMTSQDMAEEMGKPYLTRDEFEEFKKKLEGNR